ncbi:amino acid ABC transporter [Photobacterium sanctipauli]|uniref:Amino acid ABC transporter n=2 Tax=Photobacterium sanctipauli TaxID=1342794 RepID=A0A2T3N975_9GAMM|nr:transporter substrate-binding domain-containing protein [Photobacterium sanctipauli]PSW09977.1 amino acid ABC transporter [Photobacterium sanctipauli]
MKILIFAYRYLSLYYRSALSILATFLVVLSTYAYAEKPSLTVAISTDMPPYVMDGATKGLQIDIINEALNEHSVQFVQMPIADLQTAVQQGKADAALSVLLDDTNVFYSNHYITFANYAISKKADGIKIDSVPDLKDHRVLTWQNAYLELGPEFGVLFGPDSPQRENYIEFADQAEQVKQFWQQNGDIAVIDRSIFSHFSRAMGKTMDEVILHALFSPVTHFKASFKDEEVRDYFNYRLDRMCQDGRYNALLDRYGIALLATICDIGESVKVED